MTRRSLMSLPALMLAADRKYSLIAHRGGVVDARHAENTSASIKAAIERGYWMIEVDVRRTRDGVALLHHDPTFQRYYDEPRAVGELTLAEAKALRSRIDGTPPITFDEACALCSGKVRLMLDIKVPDYSGLAATLDKYRLHETAYTLGGIALRPHLPRAKFSVNREGLRKATDTGALYLFELASEMNAESLQLCRDKGVTPVAAINTFRYTMAKRDEETGPAEDAARLIALGVTHFQIDSRYDKLFAR